MVKQISLIVEAAVILLAAMVLTSCTPFISELSDSSGCMYSAGGPVPGMASGTVVVCRSGKDKAAVFYKDAKREIKIEH